MRTVRLDANVFTQLVQLVDKRVINPEGGFATCEDDGPRWAFGYLLHDFLVAHPGTCLVRCIAKGAFQITTRKANKERRRTRMESFTLQAIENLVDFTHKYNFILSQI